MGAVAGAKTVGWYDGLVRWRTWNLGETISTCDYLLIVIVKLADLRGDLADLPTFEIIF